MKDVPQIIIERQGSLELWGLLCQPIIGHEGKVFVLVDQLTVSDDPCDHLSIEVPGWIVGAVHHLSMTHTH